MTVGRFDVSDTFLRISHQICGKRKTTQIRDLRGFVNSVKDKIIISLSRQFFIS